jgi:hypothetical protein
MTDHGNSDPDGGLAADLNGLSVHVSEVAARSLIGCSETDLEAALPEVTRLRSMVTGLEAQIAAAPKTRQVGSREGASSTASVPTVDRAGPSRATMPAGSDGHPVAVDMSRPARHPAGPEDHAGPAA